MLPAPESPSAGLLDSGEWGELEAKRLSVRQLLDVHKMLVSLPPAGREAALQLQQASARARQALAHTSPQTRAPPSDPHLSRLR